MRRFVTHIKTYPRPLFRSYTIQNATSEALSPQKQGFLYEEESISVLNNKYSFNVAKVDLVGASGDRGIDFKGVFQTDRMVPVIGQCKREKKPVSIKIVRELEGTLSQYAPVDVFTGVLVSFSGFSKQAKRHASQSNYPLILTVMRDDALIDWILNEKSRQAVGPNLFTAVQRSTNDMKKLLFLLQKDDKYEPLVSTDVNNKEL
ncbi:hypothetical protein AKO1_015085 [Acrasis kona]|uniref:Restriction endonuclease type IV Mrr domain-containing protein n=1 Tax=Acrasis kona TaxID=1008807 RepID=A0AAW2YR46_9EUKA